MVFHLDNLYTFNASNQLSWLFIDTHLTAESTRVVVGDCCFFFGFEIHVKSILDKELSCVHDFDAFKFVVACEGSETFST
jgi:hypothetical protein